MEQRGEVEATCNDTSDVWENRYVFVSKTQSSFKVRYAYIVEFMISLFLFVEPN